MKKGEVDLDYLDAILQLEAFKPEPVFNKHGRKVKDKFFRLTMSPEAVALAQSAGWKREIIYRKRNGKLVKEVCYQTPVK